MQSARRAPLEIAARNLLSQHEGRLEITTLLSHTMPSMRCSGSLLLGTHCSLQHHRDDVTNAANGPGYNCARWVNDLYGGNAALACSSFPGKVLTANPAAQTCNGIVGCISTCWCVWLLGGLPACWGVAPCAQDLPVLPTSE